MLFMSCVCHALASVHAALWLPEGERVDLLTLACNVYCDFATFPFGILGQVWYFIVSIPDHCCLSYFYTPNRQLFISCRTLSYFGTNLK